MRIDYAEGGILVVWERQAKLRTALRKELTMQQAYGNKKHDDKIITSLKKRDIAIELGQKGYSKEEIKIEKAKINESKDKIYWDGTMKQYTRDVDRFCDFVLEQTGTERMSVQESKEYIQPWLNSMADKGLASGTIKTYMHAVLKAVHERASGYDRPKVSYADRRKGGDYKAINDEKNRRNHADILDLNRVVGVRRNELPKIKLDDIKMTDRGIEVYTVGKGGKHNTNVIRDSVKQEVLLHYVERAKAEGRKTLVTAAQMKNDADLHSERAHCAKDYYKYIMDEIRANPQKREEYKAHINTILRETGRQPKTNRQFEHDYFCRGDNKLDLLEQGKPIRYDRVATMMVSIEVLNHYREDTTINFYLSR